MVLINDVRRFVRFIVRHRDFVKYVWGIVFVILYSVFLANLFGNHVVKYHYWPKKLRVTIASVWSVVVATIWLLFLFTLQLRKFKNFINNKPQQSKWKYVPPFANIFIRLSTNAGFGFMSAYLGNENAIVHYEQVFLFGALSVIVLAQTFRTSEDFGLSDSLTAVLLTLLFLLKKRKYKVALAAILVSVFHVILPLAKFLNEWAHQEQVPAQQQQGQAHNHEPVQNDLEAQVQQQPAVQQPANENQGQEEGGYVWSAWPYLLGITFSGVAVAVVIYGFDKGYHT